MEILTLPQPGRKLFLKARPLLIRGSALPVKTRLCPVPSDDSSRRPTGRQSASVFAVAGISLE